MVLHMFGFCCNKPATCCYQLNSKIFDGIRIVTSEPCLFWQVRLVTILIIVKISDQIFCNNLALFASCCRFNYLNQVVTSNSLSPLTAISVQSLSRNIFAGFFFTLLSNVTFAV